MCLFFENLLETFFFLKFFHIFKTSFFFFGKIIKNLPSIWNVRLFACAKLKKLQKFDQRSHVKLFQFKHIFNNAFFRELFHLCKVEKATESLNRGLMSSCFNVNMLFKHLFETSFFLSSIYLKREVFHMCKLEKTSEV